MYFRVNLIKVRLASIQNVAYCFNFYCSDLICYLEVVAYSGCLFLALHIAPGSQILYLEVTFLKLVLHLFTEIL